MPGLFTSAEPSSLTALLGRVFGHPGFRAHQQEVCEAAAAGRDVLLVMPTGAGKSLCYQLPALARANAAAAAGRNSACLVVSPLIALMDDQAGKLSALGLRVARIHSGLSRENARQACRDYLDGNLDFLFIAPERMRVPGFPEMLARRTPALVAIDEAHCISQWGHDFRPDYRTLGQFLPALRPAPLIALTATATPTVQRDIAVQLGLQDPAIFITGFRRENLQVEVVELSKPQRAEYTVDLLKEPAARPAIVYAASRKMAEELAVTLNAHFPARAYHAGLEASVREGVQTAFQTGKLQVVVATVAFGMGVDKADVRTVVHTALPGSVEAYYQEIGRAGRDGQRARTVLLYGFADRKTQEFLLDRSYPARGELERVAVALDGDWTSSEDLQFRLKLDREALDRALEKLQGHGVCEVDWNGQVRATGQGHGWEPGYDAQLHARRDQIDRMMAYAQGHGCRMAALVEHFGDRSRGAQGACGICDICQPSDETGEGPDAGECRRLRTILEALGGRGTSTGKLFTETAVTSDRKEFDRLLDGLARAGLVQIANDSFRNEAGTEVTYRKVTVTHEGRTPDDATLATVRLRGGPAGASKPARARERKAVGAGHKTASSANAPLTGGQEAFMETLRAWRLERARAAGKPPFTIFHDSVLAAIARARPQRVAELGTISGIGPQKLDSYGVELLALCRAEAGTAPEASASMKKPQETPRADGSKRIAPRQESKPAELPRPRPYIVAAPQADAGVQAFAKPALAARAQPSVVSAAPGGRRSAAPVNRASLELSAAQLELQTRLQAWRLETARAAGLPSFFILSDTLLRGVALAEPRSLVELSTVNGLGADKIDRFGEALVAVCRG